MAEKARTIDPSLERQLTKEAERLYGCTVLLPGLATEDARVYRCARPSQAFILKALPAQRQAPPRILGTFSFVAHLRAGGVPAPAPVESAAGRTVETAEVGGEAYTLWAVEEVPGARVDWRDWTPELFRRWGALLGKMHALARTFQLPPGSERPTWQDEWAFDYRHIPADHAHIRERADALREWMTSLPQTVDAFGLGHADFHQENFFVDGGVIHPFDFDNCLYDWFVADFAPILHNALLAQAFHRERGEHDYWTGGEPMNGPEFAYYFLRHFWDGYRREHPIDPSWLRHLPSFFYRRHLSVWTGRVKSRSPADGEFPWRSFEQHAAELEDSAWIDALFAPALRELEW